MGVEYCYKLPENGKHRKIPEESIKKVLKAIDSYLRNPESGKKEIKQVVIPFIFHTLGFFTINKEVIQNNFDQIPTTEDKARYFVAELITIIEYMIKENPDKMEISKGQKEPFLEGLLSRKAKCPNIENVEDSRSSFKTKRPEKAQKDSYKNSPYEGIVGTKNYYYKQLIEGATQKDLADDICNNDKLNKRQKTKRLQKLLSQIKKYYDDLYRKEIGDQQINIEQLGNERDKNEGYIKNKLEMYK